MHDRRTGLVLKIPYVIFLTVLLTEAFLRLSVMLGVVKMLPGTIIVTVEMAQWYPTDLSCASTDTIFCSEKVPNDHLRIIILHFKAYRLPQAR